MLKVWSLALQDFMQTLKTTSKQTKNTTLFHIYVATFLSYTLPLRANTAHSEELLNHFVRDASRLY